MEAASLAFSVAQTLFAALQCSELRDLLSNFHYQSKLERLENTVRTIKSVLLSADSKEALTPEEWNFIEDLKDVVYEADDLFDELITVARQQQLPSRGKVRDLFSHLEELVFSYKMSHKVKDIRKKLDGIADDANKFSFKIDDQPIRKRREETCSYVNVNDIIGRDDDQRRIVDRLLDPNDQEDVSVLAIVGIGGLGKTALAQFVYHDPRIQEHFPLRLWVCVSDEEKNQFNVKQILANILKSTGQRHIDDLSLDKLVQELRKKLDESKYLLVLDDVWTENNGDWLKLKPYLLGLHHRGSKIVVTTRSMGTALATGSIYTHELQGLSDENSWRLFEMVVGSERANCHDLADIGKDIVKKCANVPLAVRVVGSLLYGQDVNTWRSFQKSRLSEIRKDKNDIMPILEFSYRHLSPALKSCFMYCALFPKDFEINKETLLNLWMAQDYVEQLDEGQNIEDAAEEYFQILARRCFFQDVVEESNETVTFKIHDLMHDMAQRAAGKEIFIENSTTSIPDKKVRHLFDRAFFSRTKEFIVRTKIRTYVNYQGGAPQFPLSILAENWRSLRALDLCWMGLTSLPDTIGQLLHLRYLDLSGNTELEMLPKSLTKLINLQFFNLDKCIKLKELPKDLSKLVNLRTLYVPHVLEYMPLGMAKMTCLTRLNIFVVGQRKSCLEDLRALRNLKGSLQIYIGQNYKRAKEYWGDGGYICNTENLKAIDVQWLFLENERGGVGNDEDLLEDLQPHCNLKELTLGFYGGVRIPRWAREDSLTTSLPNLVKIQLENCHGLQELPWLGRLQHLKTLCLRIMRNVEYMENRSSIGSSSDGGAVASSIFFPSLEALSLSHLPKLKGWWRGTSNSTSGSGPGMGEDEVVNCDRSMLSAPAHTLPSFPRLSKLSIDGCPKLTFIPLCPAVETLDLLNLNERFRILIDEDEKGVGGSSSSNNDSGNSKRCSKLREIETSSLGYLKSLPMVAFHGVTKMGINGDDEVESLSEMEEVFHRCSSSLRSLSLSYCSNLNSVSPGGLEYLTALETLKLRNLPELSFDETEEKEEEEGLGSPWRCFGQCLHSLELLDLKKVVNLPKGMRHLTALQSLEIRNLPLKDLPEWIGCRSSLQSLSIDKCKHLESLPDAMWNLTSLRELRLYDCKESLWNRCRKPDGEDWPTFNISPFQSEEI